MEDLTGKKFERLKVIGPAGEKIKGKDSRWICECKCGKITEASASNLKRGHVKSCGCLRNEALKNNAKVFYQKYWQKKSENPNYLLPRYREHQKKMFEYVKMVEDKRMTYKEVIAELGISRGGWYLWVKKYRIYQENEKKNLCRKDVCNEELSGL